MWEEFKYSWTHPPCTQAELCWWRTYWHAHKWHCMREALSTDSAHVPCSLCIRRMQTVLELTSYVLLWPSGMSPAFHISDLKGQGSGCFYCSTKEGTCTHDTCGEHPPVRHANALQEAGCCTLSPHAVSKHCTTWAWCVWSVLSDLDSCTDFCPEGYLLASQPWPHSYSILRYILTN